MYNKGLTLKDQNLINTKCRVIAKLERHGVREEYLRRELYMLGLFAFRQFHKAGMPEDVMHPGLNYKLLIQEKVSALHRSNEQTDTYHWLYRSRRHA